jgi:hypothetical protein
MNHTLAELMRFKEMSPLFGFGWILKATVA